MEEAELFIILDEVYYSQVILALSVHELKSSVL